MIDISTPENHIGHEVAKLTRDVVCMTRHSSEHVSEKLVSVRIVSQGQGRKLQNRGTNLHNLLIIYLVLRNNDKYLMKYFFKIVCGYCYLVHFHGL